MRVIRTEIFIGPDTSTYGAINRALTDRLGAEGIRGPGEVQAEVAVVLGVTGAQKLTGLKVRFSRRKGLRVVGARFDTLPFPELDVARVVIRGRIPQVNAPKLHLAAEVYRGGEDPLGATALRILGDIFTGHLIWRIEVHAFRLADANKAFDHAIEGGGLPITSGSVHRISRSAPWSEIEGL